MKSYSELALILVLLLLNITTNKKLRKTKSEEASILVLDMDDLFTYVSFSQSDEFLKIPTVVAKSGTGDCLMIGCGKLSYGQDIFKKPGANILPIQNGRIAHNYWNFYELFLDYVFYENLKIDPTETHLLMTINALTDKLDKERIAKLIFQKYKFSYLLLRSSSKLVLDASETSTAIVCELKYSTLVVPYEESNQITSASVQSDFGINSLINEFLKNSIFESVESHLLKSNREFIAEDIIYTLSYVAENFEQEKRRFSNKDNSSYRLSSGQVLTIGSERFTIPELLFNPSGLGNDDLKGIQFIIHEAIMKSPPEIRKNLYENIILSGQYANIPGLARRLEKELSALAPNMKILIRVTNIYSESSPASRFNVNSLTNNNSFMKIEDYNSNSQNIHRYFLD